MLNQTRCDSRIANPRPLLTGTTYSDKGRANRTWHPRSYVIRLLEEPYYEEIYLGTLHYYST